MSHLREELDPDVAACGMDDRTPRQHRCGAALTALSRHQLVRDRLLVEHVPAKAAAPGFRVHSRGSEPGCRAQLQGPALRSRMQGSASSWSETRLEYKPGPQPTTLSPMWMYISRRQGPQYPSPLFSGIPHPFCTQAPRPIRIHRLCCPQYPFTLLY